MHTRQRRIWVAVAATAALAAGGGAMAWACTAAASLSVRWPDAPLEQGGGVPGTALSGAPGAQVSVVGTYFRSDVPVQVRWNNADGPVLATAEGPDFSLELSIPDDAPGVHTVVAVQPAGELGDPPVQRAVAVEVLMPGSAPVRSPGLFSEPGPASAGPSTNGSGNTTMALGAGLLGVGTVALFGGAAAVTLRRRRATATATEAGTDLA